MESMIKHVLANFGSKKNEKLKKEQKSITSEEQQSLGSFLWKPYYGLIPIHVCGHSIATLPTRVFGWAGWALRPLGFQEIPVKVFKVDGKTVIQIETGKEWMVYECGQMAGWAMKPFRFADKFPVKIIRDGAKSIIQIEAVEGIFCDCNKPGDESLGQGTLETIDAVEEPVGEEKTTPVYENLLNDFIKYTEEEEDFLNRRAYIRRSYNKTPASKSRKRRNRSSSLSNLKTIRENMAPIETNNNINDFESIESEEIENFEPRPALDIPVKSTLRKKSKLNQSIENFKNAFSNVSPKLIKPRRKRGKRTSSMIIVL